jgi:hypothetical protein
LRATRRLKPTHAIVMTDPPFLTTWVSQLRRIPWALWSMDVYPEAFAAAGLAGERSVLFRRLQRRVYRRTPQLLISLGPLQGEYLRKKYRARHLPQAILPCGVVERTEPREIPAWRRQQRSKILLGYCGNLGEAHSVEFLRAVIETMDRDRFHLILSVYGSKARQLLDPLDPADPGITRLPEVSRAELSWIDVHLVSLLGKWAHVCVPSKAVSAVCCGSPFLFFGSPDCDNWGLLQAAGWLVPESSADDSIRANVASGLAQITASEIEQKRRQARIIGARLRAMTERGYAAVAAWIKSAPIPPSGFDDDVSTAADSTLPCEEDSVCDEQIA